MKKILTLFFLLSLASCSFVKKEPLSSSPPVKVEELHTAPVDEEPEAVIVVPPKEEKQKVAPQEKSTSDPKAESEAEVGY